MYRFSTSPFGMTVNTVVMDGVTECKKGCTRRVQGHRHRDRYRGHWVFSTSRPTAPSLEVEDRATIWRGIRNIYSGGESRGDGFSSIPSLEGIGKELTNSLAAPHQSRG